LDDHCSITLIKDVQENSGIYAYSCQTLYTGYKAIHFRVPWYNFE